MREPDWVVLNKIQCQCDLCCLNFDKNVVKILKRVVGLVQGLLNKEIQFFHILFFLENAMDTNLKKMKWAQLFTCCFRFLWADP